MIVKREKKIFLIYREKTIEFFSYIPSFFHYVLRKIINFYDQNSHPTKSGPAGCGKRSLIREIHFSETHIYVKCVKAYASQYAFVFACVCIVCSL